MTTGIRTITTMSIRMTMITGMDTTTIMSTRMTMITGNTITRQRMNTRTVIFPMSMR